MTHEEAIGRIRECQCKGDTEASHANADDVLCDFLESLGYRDIVDEFNKVDKWYS